MFEKCKFKLIISLCLWIRNTEKHKITLPCQLVMDVLPPTHNSFIFRFLNAPFSLNYRVFYHASSQFASATKMLQNKKSLHPSFILRINTIVSNRINKLQQQLLGKKVVIRTCHLRIKIQPIFCLFISQDIALKTVVIRAIRAFWTNTVELTVVPINRVSEDQFVNKVTRKDYTHNSFLGSSFSCM